MKLGLRIEGGACIPGAERQEIPFIEDGAADKPPGDSAEDDSGDKDAFFQKIFVIKTELISVYR